MICVITRVVGLFLAAKGGDYWKSRRGVMYHYKSPL